MIEAAEDVHDAEPQEQIALADRSVNARAHAFGALGEGFEIDMRCQVPLARLVEQACETMAADRLQGLAGGADAKLALVRPEIRRALWRDVYRNDRPWRRARA